MSNQYVTPDLSYPYDALEPHIDKETMIIHHDKHHVAYTKKFNTAVEKYPELFEKKPEELLISLAKIPGDIRVALRNNGGGHVNHALFWSVMDPDGGGEPAGKLAEDINIAFGSFEQFQKQFTEAATRQFGSGWVWLVLEANGQLAVTTTANQDTPLSEGKIPLLLLDVWEHAYYLRYQNRRSDYVKSWWNVVHWKKVAELFTAAIK